MIPLIALLVKFTSCIGKADTVGYLGSGASYRRIVIPNGGFATQGVPGCICCSKAYLPTYQTQPQTLRLRSNQLMPPLTARRVGQARRTLQ